MEDLFGIYWAGIDRIIVLPIFILMIYLVFRRLSHIKKGLASLVHTKHQNMLFNNFSANKQLCKAILFSISLICIFLALLQPQWGKKEQTVIQEGRDLLIILDISRSMSAKDIQPTRLDFAKLKIRHLLTKIPSERVGLIVFSGTAFVQCPLTADHSAFSMFLKQVDTETISSGTTSLDNALKTALTVLNTSGSRKTRLAVVLTDGEDFSLNLDSVQRKAIQEQLHLFALGIGTPEGAPIPKFDARGNQVGHEVDEHGNVVLSLLNEKTLENLCSSLGGHYQQATYDDDDIEALCSSLSQYEKETFSDKKMSLFHDQYPWLLAVAWICLILEWII